MIKQQSLFSKDLKSKSATKGLVLLVDDNEEYLHIIGSYLEKWQFSVDKFSCADFAIAAIKKNVYCCIIMDLNMPGTDGISASMFIRSQSKINENTPIIVASACDSDAIHYECSRVGVNKILSKPFSAFELENSFLELGLLGALSLS